MGWQDAPPVVPPGAAPRWAAAPAVQAPAQPPARPPRTPVPPKEPGMLATAARKVQGAGELAASGVANLVATPLAGIAGLVTRPIAAAQGYDPGEASTAVIEDIRGRAAPGEAGRELLAPLAPAMEKAGAAFRSVLPENDVAETAIPAALEAGLELSGLAGAKAVGSAVKTAKTAKAAAPAAAVVGGNATQTARNMGFRLRPSDVQAVVPGEKVPGTLAEHLNEPASLKRDFTLHNQRISTREAATELGLKDAKQLGDAEFNRLKAPEFTTYTAAEKAATRVGLSPELQTALSEGIGRAKFKPGENPGITKTIGALRRRSAEQIKSNDVATQEAGFADRELADRLEDAFGKQLEAVGDAEMLTQYQAARQRLAKIHDVETATRAGQVDISKLYAMKKRGVPLTGRLAMLAEVGENFPHIARHSLSTAGNQIEHAANRSRIIRDVGSALIRNVPGLRSKLNVGTEGFQNRLGRDMNEALPREPGVMDAIKAPFRKIDEVVNAPANELRRSTAEARRSYFGDYGVKPTTTPAFKPPVDPGIPFETRGGITPPAASSLAGDLDLLPDPVANAQALPPVPPRMIADTPPAVRGDVNFQPSPLEANRLAAALGLEPPAAAPYPGSVDWVPPSLADQLVGDQRIAPPRVESQFEMPGVAAPQRDRLQLTEGAGPKKGKVTHVADETGQHTVETPNGYAIAQENGDLLQVKRIDVATNARRSGEGRSMMERLLQEAGGRGLQGLSSDVSVSPAHAKMFDDLEARGYEVIRNAAEVNPTTGNLVSLDPRVPVFEVRPKLGTAIAPEESATPALLRPQAGRSPGDAKVRATGMLVKKQAG